MPSPINTVTTRLSPLSVIRTVLSFFLRHNIHSSELDGTGFLSTRIQKPEISIS